jgi:HEPN domain-containing protein
MTNDDERTTPVGLFNYARSYWRAGCNIDHDRLAKIEGVTHPDAPITYLFYHAIELYLKAFLRLHGIKMAKLKKIGHRYERLAEKAKKHDLALPDEDWAVIYFMAGENVVPPSRYIKMGDYRRPKMAALSRVCRNLDDAILRALEEAGFPARIWKASSETTE